MSSVAGETSTHELLDASGNLSMEADRLRHEVEGFLESVNAA